MGEAILVTADELNRFVAAFFEDLGMMPANAERCAADIVLTNLWGIDSHGVLRLPIYARRLAEKVIKANPAVTVVASRGAFEILDGDAGMGFLVGHAAMERAVELAGQHGIGAVAVSNSNHFGAAALFANQATQADLIGLAMTNVTPNLVVPGGTQPITGNNPIAFGVPTPIGFPLLLDISMSAVAGGKLLLAAEKGEKIPLDWATDKSGRPTDDPDVGFQGFLMPLGGHKGFGLSLMVDILCGVVAGGAFQFGIKSMYSHPQDASETGHMMIALDPAIALDRGQFLNRMRAFYRTVKSSPTWEEDRAMYIPGEIENETKRQRLRDGIPIPRTLFHELTEMSAEYNIRVPLTERQD